MSDCTEIAPSAKQGEAIGELDAEARRLADDLEAAGMAEIDFEWTEQRKAVYAKRRAKELAAWLPIIRRYLASRPAPTAEKGEAIGELTIEAVNAGLAVGLMGDDAPELARKTYHQNPYAHRIAQTIQSARPAPTAEKALREGLGAPKILEALEWMDSGNPASFEICEAAWRFARVIRAAILAHEAPKESRRCDTCSSWEREHDHCRSGSPDADVSLPGPCGTWTPKEPQS